MLLLHSVSDSSSYEVCMQLPKGLIYYYECSTILMPGSHIMTYCSLWSVCVCVRVHVHEWVWVGVDVHVCMRTQDTVCMGVTVNIRCVYVKM